MDIKNADDCNSILDLVPIVSPLMSYADHALLEAYSARYAEQIAPLILKYSSNLDFDSQK